MSVQLRIRAGGTLNSRQDVYIPRPEDSELFDLLVDRQYANVLTSRQTGKSSLVISTIYRLYDRGVRTAYVDLTSIGTPGEVEGYYKGLVDKIARDLKLSINVIDWWQGVAGETNNQQFMRFFRDVVAGAADSPAVVFLDEIDSTLKLAFTDDLFTAIRAMYNERALVPAYERVTFCLVGVATPNELIKDRRTTAYNVGRTLELRDFDSSRDNLASLATALSGESGTGNAMLARVLHWTDGHPYLTMRLALSMIERGARSADDVDRLIEEAFQTLDRVSSDVHFQQILRFIETRLSHGPDSLSLYQGILGGMRERDTPTLANAELKLSGLVKRDLDGFLVVRNRLYARLFDHRWVEGARARLSYHQYEVLRRDDGSLWELGRGAMGITFKAFDTNLRFPVALKVINSAYLESETARQRFLREARAAAALRHANVASVFNLGIEEDRYFYVTEFIDGETVEARVRRQGPLEPVEALNIGLQVTRALAVAAKQQLVHRDLKPSNLMLVSQEGEQIVKVIDFGLAKGPRDAGNDSSALTVAGFVGTPHFASPEQIEEQEVDIRSDIYSLGLTLYFTLTGQPPFSGSAGKVMSQQLYKPLAIEPLANLPRCVVSLLQHMTEKDRNNRPQTPQDLQRAMIACLEEIGAARSVSGYPASESAGTFETLDLSSTLGQPLGVGVVLAQNYKLIEELAESPMGRSYLADDLAHKRRVKLMILSPNFLSDGRRITALEEAIRLANAAPHALLREIHPSESVADYTFLVQEHITGPSMLDILRARSVLTAPEVVRLVSLLAPLVDHANRYRFQHIDITLSGIHLIYRPSSSVGVRPDLLRGLLTSWEFLKPKVDAINFSSLPSTIETWSSPATATQGAPGGAPESCMRLLSMLAYELLGGPRTRLETTGQYTPLAALTQEGNAVLRRGVADEFPSAEEFSRQLAAATSVATSAPDVSGLTRQPQQTQDSRIPPPQARVPVSDQRKPLAGKWRWILILCPIILLGIGFYLLSLFRGSQEIPALSIRTDPANVAIFLDGKPPDIFPDTFTHVPFGTHRLSATLPDYYPIREEIQIRKGTPPEIHLQLKPVQEIAALSITTEPPGAAILLDGKTPQSPPNTFTHVSFGAHQLTATLENYETLKQEIQVKKGMAPQIQLQLTPSRN